MPNCCHMYSCSNVFLFQSEKIDTYVDTMGEKTFSSSVATVSKTALQQSLIFDRIKTLLESAHYIEDQLKTNQPSVLSHVTNAR